MSIHQAPPKFTEQNISQEILETGIKVIDLIGGMPEIRLFDTFSARGNRLPDRPCDFIVILRKGKAILIEVKETQFEKGFLLSAIRPSQLTALQQAYDLSVPYLFIVRAKAQKSYYVIPGEVIVEERLKLSALKFQKQSNTGKKRVITSYIRWETLEPYRCKSTQLFDTLFKMFTEYQNS